MHWETSIYICLQAAGSLNLPPGMAIPDFQSLSRQAKRDAEVYGQQRKLDFPVQTIVVGHDDDDTVDEDTPFDPARQYGWDVEHPRRSIDVGAFKIDALPITNGDYFDWLDSSGGKAQKGLVPASWAESAEGFSVKTLYGLVPLDLAREWPLAGSAEQLERFAQVCSPSEVLRRVRRSHCDSSSQYKGGRLPTFAEMSAFQQQNLVSTPLANVGFVNLHPVAPFVPGKARDGSQLPIVDGGLWQWTSTILEPWKGYSGSKLYPGYSSDVRASSPQQALSSFVLTAHCAPQFFDGKHQIVLGSSYASPRRLARPSFLNWYQKNCTSSTTAARALERLLTPLGVADPFMLGGARVAYDA